MAKVTASKTASKNKKTNLKIGKKFKLNKWLVFDGIALLIIAGVLLVRYSHAGVDYAFYHGADQMQSGSLARRIDGTAYRHVTAANGIHGETSANVTAANLQASSKVCVDTHVNSANTFIDIQVNGRYANKFVGSPGDATICVDLQGQTEAGVVYAGTSGDANIYSIYGVR